MAKWKFDWLKSKAPEAADAALAAAETKAEGSVAEQAALQDLVKKEAEPGAPIQDAEAPVSAEKDAPVGDSAEQVADVLEIDPEGLADLMAELVDAVEGLKAAQTERKEADLAPAVEEGFASVKEAFAKVQSERDAQAQQIKELNTKLDIVAAAVQQLVGLQPRAAQKSFAVEYRASESSENIASKEGVDAIAVSRQPDAFAQFAKWAGIPTQ